MMVGLIEVATVSGVDMELRKSRAVLVVAVLALAATLLLLVNLLGGRATITNLGCFAVFAATAVALFAYALRPFRFAISAEGLTLRRRGLNRVIAWSDVETILLNPSVAAVSSRQRRSTRLLLMPVDGADIGAPPTEHSPLDGRPCLLLLDFNDVRNTPDEVADALARFGGNRFVDLRRVIDDRFSVEFSIVLRGYDPGAVDQLVTDGRRALLASSWPQRFEVKTRIEAASLPTVMRGYDREQVDQLLAALSAQLAVFPKDEPRPKQPHDRNGVDEQLSRQTRTDIDAPAQTAEQQPQLGHTAAETDS